MAPPEGREPRVPLALLEAARQGEEGAILEVLARAQPDVRRLARRACRADAVDDAVQDALWLLARRIGTLRAAAAFPGWLFTLVRRECQRLARRAFLAEPVDALDERLATRPEHELRLDLAAAIQSLPEHHRAVVLLRDVEERTVDEIAAALSLTREAVKGRLHRARALLREYLER